MANVKTRAGVIRNAVGAPLSGKVATLRNEVTGSPIGTTVNTDPDGRYTFPNLDETIRYRVEVAFGGGSSQMHVNSPISPDLDHAYVNNSLRSAAAATVAFGGPVSVGGGLTAVGGITVGGAAALNSGGSVAGTLSFAAGSKIAFAAEVIDDKISLYPGGYTIGIRGSTQGYFVPASSAHRFFVNGVDTFAVGSGNATLAGTLAVTGLASLQGGVGVTGASTLNGAVNVGGGLTVAGATAINNTLFVNSQTTMAGQLIINAGMDLTVQNGATRLTGVLLHAGGYAYFGDFNTAGVYPLAAHSVAVGWNFTSGGRDATIWNTDVANNHTSGNTSFALRQLLPGDTRNDLLTISAGGRATFKAFNAGAPGLSLVNSAGTHMMGFGINGSNFATMCVLAAHMTGSGGAATRNTWGAAPAAACQRVPIADEFGNHVGWVPVYQ